MTVVGRMIMVWISEVRRQKRDEHITRRDCYTGRNMSRGGDQAPATPHLASSRRSRPGLDNSCELPSSEAGKVY
jgi:hypothetical protein